MVARGDFGSSSDRNCREFYFLRDGFQREFKKQFERPIAEFQGLQWMLAHMSIQIDAARLLICRAALSGQEFPDMCKSAQAKIFAAEMAFKVCSDALEKVCVFGEVLALRDGTIHGVRNDSDVVSVSLHIYGKHINHTSRSQYDASARTAKPFIVKMEE